MKRTEVVHVKDGFDVYIGRAMPGHPASEFANPYRIGVDGGRNEVIDKYEIYIRNRLANEPALRDALEAMRGRRIGCWCRRAASVCPTRKPHPQTVRCHGDVLVYLLEGPEPPPAQIDLF